MSIIVFVRVELGRLSVVETKQDKNPIKQVFLSDMGIVNELSASQGE